MSQTYKATMPTKTLAIFYTLLALAAAAAVWAFRAGFIWTGICTIVVAAPFTLLYWYMLVVNPARSEIEVLDAGLRIYNPPFIDAAVPYDDIQRAFVADVKKDERLAFKQTRRGMNFGGYRSGVFVLAGGAEALATAATRRVLCLDTGDRYYLVGPKKFDEFIAEMSERVSVKD